MQEDEEWWESKGTWRVPPIIIDVERLKEKSPRGAELNGPFQLVEGHTRYRNFHILEISKGFMAPIHDIFLLTNISG